MLDYKTVQEIADEWNTSSRHIQYLCRQQKIEGAIKRAGSWFIPGDALIPLKNTKSDVKDFQFVGSKNRILDSAIELFMLRGFDNVSLKDIANSVGLRQSTIYNHFGSKQEILDTLFDFYCHHFLECRLSLNDVEYKLRNEGIMDVFRCVTYDFKDEYLKKMTNITKIIFQRISIDDRAEEIAKSLLIAEGIQYVETVFNRAIEIGRFAPFDTHLMAVFINSFRVFLFYYWIVNPSDDDIAKLKGDERVLFECASKFVTDLKY